MAKVKVQQVGVP